MDAIIALNPELTPQSMPPPQINSSVNRSRVNNYTFFKNINTTYSKHHQDVMKINNDSKINCRARTKNLTTATSDVIKAPPFFLQYL